MANKDNLDLLLEKWQDTPKRDPQLTHRVWSRIAVEDGVREPSFLGWLTGASNALTRPFGAVTFVTACIICGLVVAQFRVSQEKETRTDALAKSYLQLLQSQQQSIDLGMSK